MSLIYVIQDELERTCERQGYARGLLLPLPQSHRGTNVFH